MRGAFLPKNHRSPRLLAITSLALMGNLRDDRDIDMRNSMNAFNPAHFRAQFPALADAGVYG